MFKLFFLFYSKFMLRRHKYHLLLVNLYYYGDGDSDKLVHFLWVLVDIFAVCLWWFW